MHRLIAAMLCCVAITASHAGRMLTVPDFSTFNKREGETYIAIFVTPLPDGSHLVTGSFEVWYEGKRFRDLIRLLPDGAPDLAWNVTGDTGITSFESYTITPYGLYVVARAGAAAKSHLWFVPLDFSRPLSRVPVPGDDQAIYRMSNHDRSNDSLYVTTAAGLVRVSAATGQSRVIWTGDKDSNAAQLEPLIADSGGGLWVEFTASSFMLVDYLTYRLSVADLTANPAIRARATHFLQSQGQTRLYQAAGEYVYLPTQRRLANGERDPSWFTSDRSLRHVSDRYVYVDTADQTALRPASGILRRLVTNNDTGPATWKWTPPTGFAPWGGLPFVWSTLGDRDNLAVLGRLPAVDNGAPLLGVAVNDDPIDLAAATDPTVVEYYLPTLKRYFITGRKNEQDALDALPQSFQRTGMTFAAKSSRYRDIPEQPVCRMYFPPANGGSNTHFYGVGSDCATLNKLGGMKYEGYDFSVLKPASGACPAAAPTAVTRLYNNKAATNESNHRYVVSEATKARMLAQGWIDEGAVFCAPSATDATS